MENNTSSTNIIELKHITKTFEDGFVAVEDFNLTVKRGEFVTFLGPSGCGKTTTLRMIAGFEIPTEGEILLDGKEIGNLPPNKRPINTVFQRYALFPHLNIFDNIAFGLKLKKLPKDEIKRKVKKVLEMVDLEGFETRKVATLSGGQQQRIAIARALVNEPQILLLDEPLGALDLKMRKEMQLELKSMHERLGITFIYVTHDTLQGVVTHLIFKGVHYEITVESGKNEIVIQSTKTAAVGSQVGLNVEPDGIHIMIPEHTLNKIESDVDKNYELTIFDGKIQCDLTKIIPGSKFNDAHELLDAHGDVIDYEKLKVVLAIKPRHISMSDNEEEGIVCGHIINLIYKGDHYSYVVRTDMDEDFIVNDEYLWNMDDYVSLVIPEEHIQFSIKK